MALEEAIYLVLVSASAIGVMAALQELGLSNIIQSNPLISLIGFLILMGSAGKIAEKVSGGK